MLGRLGRLYERSAAAVRPRPMFVPVVWSDIDPCPDGRQHNKHELVHSSLCPQALHELGSMVESAVDKEPGICWRCPMAG